MKANSFRKSDALWITYRFWREFNRAIEQCSNGFAWMYNCEQPRAKKHLNLYSVHIMYETCDFLVHNLQIGTKTCKKLVRNATPPCLLTIGTYKLFTSFRHVYFYVGLLQFSIIFSNNFFDFNCKHIFSHEPILQTKRSTNIKGIVV